MSRLMLDTTIKLNIGEKEVFELAAARDHREKELSASFLFYEQTGILPLWVIDFCLDALTERIVLPKPRMKAKNMLGGLDKSEWRDLEDDAIDEDEMFS